MKKTILIASLSIVGLGAAGQININKALNSATSGASGLVSGNTTNLSTQEITSGLKEALDTGTKKSTSKASAADGFNKNSAIRIPFPPEAVKVKNTVENLGMKKQVDKFVVSLNRAAEDAAKEAAPIFMGAIKDMSITDGVAILKGADNAATNYLKEKTTDQLKVQFAPIVKSAIQKAEVTKYWNPIITKYNKVPNVQKVNPNLEEYVTIKAIEGLFTLIADEELKIRKDPGSRGSDLLKKVFGQ